MNRMGYCLKKWISLVLIGGGMGFLWGYPSFADIVTLKDGTKMRCEVISDSQVSETGAAFLQIRVDNSMIWLSRDAVERVERRPETGPAGSELHDLVEKLKREGRAFENLPTQTDFSALTPVVDQEVELKVQEVRGWIYTYEDRNALVEKKRAPLHSGEEVPIGSFLSVPPNSHATFKVGDIGEIGVLGNTRLRIDEFSMNRTQSYTMDMQLYEGSVWFRAGVDTPSFKRLILTLNAAKSVIQGGLIFVETTERTGELIVTYLDGEINPLTNEKNTLNFWRSVDGPYIVSVGEAILISPATNRLPVEPSQRLAELRSIVEEWDQWQPEPLAVELDIFTPPLKMYSDFGTQPALHPYRIPIGKSMTLPPETRSLGQLLSMYKQAVERYYVDTGRYPPEEYGLEALRKSYDIGGWRGPYVSLNLPRRDLWGEPFVLEVITEGRKEYVDIRSKGPNRKDDRGLGDDIR